VGAVDGTYRCWGRVVGGGSKGTFMGVMAGGKCECLSIQYSGEGSNCMSKGSSPFQCWDPMQVQGVWSPNVSSFECVVMCQPRHWVLKSIKGNGHLSRHVVLFNQEGFEGSGVGVWLWLVC